MRCLVTGSTGFLGAFLQKALIAQGWEVDGVNSKTADLTKPDSLLRYTEKNYDTIFHLAAWTQAGTFCLDHPAEQWLINQKIHTNVLEYWSTHQRGAKLIAIGTSCSYDPSLPLEEELYLTGKPIDSLFSYAMTKRMLYAGMKAVHKQYGLSYLHVVPSTLYGPLYHTDGRQMHFIFDLIRKILTAQEKGTEVVLWGNGYQKRELVYVEDFVHTMLHLAKTQSNETFNIGMGKEHTIREFADAICAIVGYDESLIRYDESKYVGATSKVLSIEKLKSVYPTFPQTSLQDGLERTIAWFTEKKQLLEAYV